MVELSTCHKEHRARRVSSCARLAASYCRPSRTIGLIARAGGPPRGHGPLPLPRVRGPAEGSKMAGKRGFAQPRKTIFF
eukprot:scaffold310340_cov27-Tisochrysis_lutea.AAC.2